MHALFAVFYISEAFGLPYRHRGSGAKCGQMSADSRSFTL